MTRTRSIATAVTMMTPMATCCQKGATFARTKPVSRTAMIDVPMKVPRIVPRPPKMLAPPMMTEAMAYKLSFDVPVVAFADERFAVTMMAATPDMKPEIT